MAAFSRLQLAAALIEYDNDDQDPDAPRISAQESAIFAHLRRNNPRPPKTSRTSDYLGVDIPTEAGSEGGRDSEQDRKSRASSDALRNPFGRDSSYGDLELKEEDIEVDLASWGLDALVVPKDKVSKRNKAKAGILPNPHPQIVSPRPGDNRRTGRSDNRSASLGNIDMFGEGGAFLEAGSTASTRALNPRRHSIGDPLDAAGLGPSPPLATRQRRASEHFPIENLPVQPPLHSVPFPSAASVRSSSPLVTDGPSRPAHLRTTSTASMGSRILQQQPETPNPFEIRPPSPDRASRFDPKATRARTLSQGTMGTIGLQNYEDDPRASRIEPGRTRTVSGGTLGTQMMLGDDDGADSAYNGQTGPDRLYSRSELMRPKVLVMPSPLQSATSPVQPQLSPALSRDGFLHSSDGRPMPPGARPSGRRASSTLSVLEASDSFEAPVASNSFTPNPRMTLSLSQLTFRNTLMVDGTRDVAYADIDNRLKRAHEDGEKIEPDPEPEMSPNVPTVVVDAPEDRRPPGRLLGHSLIDTLEARKAEMKSKQRTFTGDSRPSMMARSNLKRSSTLIDPESLKPRPASQTFGADLSRRNSKGKTLITFDEEIPGARNSLAPLQSPRTGGDTRSVFGVDTLWERELVKLKEIEEQERKEAEAQKLKEESRKRGRKRGKGKRNSSAQGLEAVALPTSESLQSKAADRVEVLPHVLPDIQKASTPRRAPPPPGDDEESESSDSSSVVQRTGAKPTQEWHAGPQTRSAVHDVQLVKVHAVERMQTRSQLRVDSDSDEDAPLSVLLDTKLKSPVLSLRSNAMSTSLKPQADDSDEDDQPLGLRASRVIPSSSDLQEEDDKPLALHPDQIRRTQYAALQQQQFMMQAAQMHQSMMFGAPSIMGSGYFGPPMGPPAMMAAQSPMMAPPNEAAKLNRVDKWRHDVAVEGMPPS
ncbi:hypothetical protein EUX98_g1479 [Antrodiella citrinella]|uniref:Uncharacterized protein n=1 Tax=Antrodiella citrinella TaxID=2447956 RepID=A0A4S4N9T3_9APHY|nr:hypothetical protein EUX98_g1479 [Antrodiella citrinella]